MQVRMNAAMLDALKATPEIPDVLMQCVTKAEADGDGFLVPMNDDEAMAMTEMCQWYIRTDPATGKLTSKGVLFDSIVRAVYSAQDA